MDTTKIIKGAVSNGRYTVTAPIVKEDYGLYLKIEGVELPSTYEVDFSNSENNGTSVTMIGNADGVLIPHQFISTGKDIFAFLYHVGANYGRTVYKFRIPNKLRPDRTDDTPTPEEQSVIDQAISALNTAVAQTAQDKADADASAQSASADAERAEDAKTDAQTYANNASASATASANSASQSAQIKADVEELVDDAQAAANASERSASNAYTYATSAERSSVNASSSAQSASGYASQAQTSAQTASAKAQDASTSAQTASQKATESAQSASQALTYKTDAESAKADAESARDEAVQAVASISGALADKADVITDTASGSIASFTDGADDLPLKSLVVNIDPVQDLSSGDPSPENICPISGWTEIGVEQKGVNVWDEEWAKGEISRNGELIPDNTHLASKNFISVVPSSAYCLVGARAQIAAYNSEKTFLGIINSGYIGENGSNVVFNTTKNTHFIRFNCAATYGTTYNHDISINYPSTDHDYHPYTGRSITIDLGQTVYGGKLDVLSGELVIDRAMVDLGTLTWKKLDSYEGVFFTSIQDKADGQFNLICSAYATASIASAIVMPDCSMVANVRGSVTFVKDISKASMTAAEFKEAVSSFMCCYELAEPIEIQLSANQMNSLYGVNNIWADSGNTEVEYRADTKLFIERLTAPDSADMIADANITSGKYFMVGNTLYKATANIANGAQIIVGTNCTRVSLAQALNEINA